MRLANSKGERAFQPARQTESFTFPACGMPAAAEPLTCATWYGKHHSEMIGWHVAHFALWGQPELLARNLDWYVARLPAARAIAALVQDTADALASMLWLEHLSRYP